MERRNKEEVVVNVIRASTRKRETFWKLMKTVQAAVSAFNAGALLYTEGSLKL